MNVRIESMTFNRYYPQSDGARIRYQMIINTFDGGAFYWIGSRLVFDRNTNVLVTQGEVPERLCMLSDFPEDFLMTVMTIYPQLSDHNNYKVWRERNG